MKKWFNIFLESHYVVQLTTYGLLIELIIVVAIIAGCPVFK
jgi:hypothetical protein